MQLFNSTVQYGLISKALHWAMAFLIIAALVLIEVKDFFPKGSDPRNLIKFLHIQFGLSVMFLLFLRAGFKLKQQAVGLIDLERKQKLLIQGLHGAFYLIMFVLPFIGLLMTQAANKPAQFLGVSMPIFLQPNEDTADFLKETHELLGNLMIFLIVIHLAAVLFHQFIKKDDVLKRML